MLVKKLSLLNENASTSFNTLQKEPLKSLIKTTSSSEIKNKIKGNPIKTFTPQKVPLKPLIKPIISASNKSDPKTNRTNESILDKKSSQINEEKVLSFPEEAPFSSLITTPSLEIKGGNFDGTEIQIDDLNEFNLSLLGTGNENVLDTDMGSLIYELDEFVDNQNNDEINEGKKLLFSFYLFFF